MFPKLIGKKAGIMYIIYRPKRMLYILGKIKLILIIYYLIPI